MTTAATSTDLATLPGTATGIETAADPAQYVIPATARDLVAEDLNRIGDEMESAAWSLAWLRDRLGGADA